MSTENDATSDATPSVRRKARLRVVDSPVVRRSSRGGASRSRSSREEWSREDSAEDLQARRASEAPRPVSPERARWNELTEGVLSIHGAPFDPTRMWKEGDILLHKQFGMGVVEASEDLEPAQILAIFRDGQQVLDLVLTDED